MSRTVLTDILRKQIGFDGLIITDAMNMKAISENFGGSEAAKMATYSILNLICMPVILHSKHNISKLDDLVTYLENSVVCDEISEK